MKAKLFLIILVVSGVFLSSCVKDEIFQGPPVISEMQLNPQAPQENQAVTVSVKVNDMNGIKAVNLLYKVGTGSYSSVTMTANGDTYSGQIPGQGADVTVNFYIEAENVIGKKAYHPAGAPNTTATFTVGAPLILMNEIYSRGGSPATPDPDWIEIYNNSDVAVNIGGYKVYDNGGQSGAKPKLAIPAGTMLPARGFYVVTVDVGGESGFGISSGGEELWFENASGNVIDNVIVPAMDIGQSYGRNPDGSPNWELLPNLTPGSANSDTPPPPVNYILLNEIYSRGVAGDEDWIEVYNTSSSPIDLSGYKVYDNGGQSGSKPKKAFPAGTSIPGNGFVYIRSEGGGDASDFGISSGGEWIWLDGPNGTAVDSVLVAAMDLGQSYGRFPDGSENWQLLARLTPGAPNSNTPAPANFIFMNEIYSRGIDGNLDWIEVYNTSLDDIDISGYKIYDSGGNAGTKPKKEFPAGTVVPGNGFYVIVVDDDDPSGFGLSSGGEEVWLENASEVVIDNVTFPAMSVTQSYGRFTDGTDNWQVLDFVTRGTANNDGATPVIGMNEIYSRGIVGNPDWVEVFNSSAEPMDISGYKIYDSGGFSGSKPKKEFPTGSIIPGNGFLVIVVDDQDASGFGLSSGGESVWLEDAAGNIIDFVSFPALDAVQSFGRFADGAHNWQVLNYVTRGTANSDGAEPSPIVMNEIFSRGTSADPDWIEIYNNSSAEVDISGYKIYDSGGFSGSKPKMEFPAGTTIPANGFVVIVVDDAATANPTGSSFGLSSGGESVWLEDDSGSVIDYVAFPALEETQSFGRFADGAHNWEVLNTITRGAANSQK